MWAKSFLIFFFKFQDGADAGKDEQWFVHTRFVGDKTITVKQINLEGSEPFNEGFSEVSHNMTSDEYRAFQEAWDKNWNPSLDQDQPKEGGVIGFFKKMFGCG